MLLLNEDTSMMNRLGQTSFEDNGLKTAFEEALDGEGQDIVKFVLSDLQKAVPKHPAKKGLTFKDATRVFLIQSEKIPRRITNPTQCILNPPQLPLTPQPKTSNQPQLCIQTLLLVRTTWLLERLPIY